MAQNADGTFTVHFVFPNQSIARHFRAWMSDGGGEWAAMESAEIHLGHSLSFDYHQGGDFDDSDTVIVTAAETEEDGDPYEYLKDPDSAGVQEGTEF